MALRILRNLLVAAALLVPMAPALAGDGHPTPVPNLTDPAVLDEFMPLALSRLNEDPDFPMLLLGRLGQASPQYLLVIYDARNGKDTWSVREGWQDGPAGLPRRGIRREGGAVGQLPRCGARGRGRLAGPPPGEPPAIPGRGPLGAADLKDAFAR